jgi:dTDP-4-amino-4,6-dideoxygalactose transaminase
VHLQPCYEHLGYRAGQFPEAERSCRLVLSLPLHPFLPFEAVDEVAAAVERFLR